MKRTARKLVKKTNVDVDAHHKYHVSFSKDVADIREAQAFRGRLFRDGRLDADAIDEIATHALIRDQYGRIVCVFRMMELDSKTLDQSYSAKFYDLATLKRKKGRALELGRFCIHPDHSDPDIIRLAWASLTNYVFEHNIDLLFGCSSFHGADAETHAEALALLNAQHLAPKGLMPKIKAPSVFEFAKKLAGWKINKPLALRGMPPLLRSYLALGGWVSDHAVIDNDLNTIHVFTGVEINKIPSKRRNLFMSLARQLGAT